MEGVLNLYVAETIQINLNVMNVVKKDIYHTIVGTIH